MCNNWDLSFDFMTRISPLYLACASLALAVPCGAAGRSESADREGGKPQVMRHVPVRGAEKIPVMSVAGNLKAEAPVEKRKGPKRRVLDNGAEIYGWLGYVDSNIPEGLYDLKTDDYDLVWADPDFTNMGDGWEMVTSWLSADGTKVCGYTTDNYYSYIYGAAYVELDLESGERTLKTEFDPGVEPLFNVAALNTTDGYIYGFGFDAEGFPYWGRANSATPTVFEQVRPFVSGDHMLCSMTYCPADGLLYAVTSGGKLVSYDSSFKATEVISSLDVPNLKSFITGLCYSDKDNLFYWNANAANPDDPSNFSYKSMLYAIDIAKKSLTLVSEFAESEEFIALYSPTVVVDGDAPMAPEFVSSGFVGGSLSGSVSFRMPGSTGSNTPITTPMSWEASVDGVTVGTGTASASEVVEVPVSDLEAGNHQFSFTVTLGEKTSKPATKRFYVGNDTPVAPTNVRITADGVSWDAVTEGVNEGYVDSQAVTYEVVVNGENKGTFSTTSAAMQIVAPDARYAAYRATVTAIFAGNRSASTVSPKLLAGQPFDLDLSIRPTAEQADLCTIIDGNGDGQSWVLYDETDDKFFNSQFSQKDEADDYLILPAVDFPDKDAYYELSLMACSRRNYFPDEYIDVRIGRTPEISAMDNVILEKTQCTEGFDKVQQLFKVPESGTWYVAIRCCSGYDQYGVFVKEINVSRSQVTNQAPQTVTDLSCEAGAQGALKAVVSFVMPSSRMDGSAIPAGTELTATVKSRNSVTVKGAPGEKVSAEVETVQGDNAVSVHVCDGSLVGPAVETTVYTGVVVPGFARNVKAKVQEDNLTVDLCWDAPLEGQDGGFIVPEEVSYEIFLYGPGGWIKEASLGSDARTYQFVADDLDVGMAIVQLGVRCLNKAGANPMVSIGTAILGMPYELPAEETFDRMVNGEYSGPDLGPSLMLAPDASYDGEWGYSRLAMMTDAWANLPGGALVCAPKSGSSKGRMALPKMSSEVREGHEVTFLLRMYTGSDCANLTKIYADTYGLDEPVLLSEVKYDRTKEWSDIELKLPANLTNRKWIQPILEVSFSNPNQLFVLDNFKVYGTEKSSVDGLVAEGAVSVTGLKGEILVSGADGHAASVYTAAGALVAVSEASRIAVPAGIYVVKVADKTAKVVVR